MMVTTNNYIQRMNMYLKRFKTNTPDIVALMQTIREHNEASADFEQTFNHSRTDSEKSDDEEVLVNQT